MFNINTLLSNKFITNKIPDFICNKIAAFISVKEFEVIRVSPENGGYIFDGLKNEKFYQFAIGEILDFGKNMFEKKISQMLLKLGQLQPAMFIFFYVKEGILFVDVYDSQENKTIFSEQVKEFLSSQIDKIGENPDILKTLE